GQPAKVAVQERPNLSFNGKVTRTSSSLDANSRTLLTEVQVENPTGILLPGMFALVRFIGAHVEPPLLVPDASLVVREARTVVAVLEPLSGADRAKEEAHLPDSTDRDGLRSVRFVVVQPGRNFGTELEILRGLQVGDEIAVDP